MKLARAIAGWVTAPMLVMAFLPGDAAARPGFAPRGPVVVSPEVKADRHVVFRLLAPKAEAVGVFTTDIPGGFRPRPMTKGEKGIWEVDLGPIDPGTYRYLYNVDGVLAADSRNQEVSESNGNSWSVVHVPGSDFMDTTDVPHGSVAGLLSLVGTGPDATDARLHAAGIRGWDRREIPGPLPAAWGRRQ